MNPLGPQSFYLKMRAMNYTRLSIWYYLAFASVYFSTMLLHNIWLFIIKNSQYVKVKWKTSRSDFSKYNVLPEYSSIMPLPCGINRTVHHPLPEMNLGMKRAICPFDLVVLTVLGPCLDFVFNCMKTSPNVIKGVVFGLENASFHTEAHARCCFVLFL